MRLGASLGANDRGFEFSDLEFEVLNYADVQGHYYDMEDNPELYPEDFDYADMDWATFVIHYPDGTVSDPRTLVGPWDDLDDFGHDVADWVENGTP